MMRINPAHTLTPRNPYFYEAGQFLYKLVEESLMIKHNDDVWLECLGCVDNGPIAKMKDI